MLLRPQSIRAHHIMELSHTRSSSDQMASWCWIRPLRIHSYMCSEKGVETRAHCWLNVAVICFALMCHIGTVCWCGAGLGGDFVAAPIRKKKVVVFFFFFWDNNIYFVFRDFAFGISSQPECVHLYFMAWLYWAQTQSPFPCSTGEAISLKADSLHKSALCFRPDPGGLNGVLFQTYAF